MTRFTRATGDCFRVVPRFRVVARFAEPRRLDLDALLRALARMLVLRLPPFLALGRDDFFLRDDFRAFVAMTPSSLSSRPERESKIQARTVEPALLQVGPIHTMNTTFLATW